MTIGLARWIYDMGKRYLRPGKWHNSGPDNEESLLIVRAPDFTLEEIFSLDVFLGNPAAYYVF